MISVRYLAITPHFPTNKQLELLRLLVKEGLDVTAVDHKGRSPAHVAAHKNEVGAITVLAQTARPTGSPSGGESSGDGRSNAGGISSTSVVGLDVLGVKDANGESPLHHAVMARHAEAIALLCDAGVDVDAVDAAGKTPCWHAVEGGEVI